MAKPRNDLIDRMQYIGLRLIEMMLQTWPLELNLAAARLLGDIMYFVDRRHRKRALGNLARSFPNMPEDRRRLMARESMRQMFLLAVEVLFTPRLISIPTFARYIDLDEVSPVLRLMLRKDGGVLMLTGHYGNWE